MLGQISKISAMILIRADLNSDLKPQTVDVNINAEVQYALCSLKEKAGTEKKWEWELSSLALWLGYRDGSYYIREYTSTELEELDRNRRIEQMRKRWVSAIEKRSLS